MTYTQLLNREFKRSGEKVKITKLPKSQQPTPSTIKSLDRQISAMLNTNHAAYFATP